MTGTTGQPETLRFHVEGMTRPSCAAKVEGAIGRIPGVRESHVDYHTGQLIVEATATVAPEAIAEAGTASGHPTVIETGGVLSRCEWAIEGMDCADCARKLDLAVSALPGVSGIAINVGSGRLRLALDETQTTPGEVVRRVRALGYTARPPAAALAAPTPWYNTAKGRLVIGSGVLIALAFLSSFVAPAFAPWAYAAATLLAVVPVARKAWGAARNGSPFDINALVSIAALGALIIGAQAEGALVVFFFAVGELLEGIAAGRARHAIEALGAVTPKTARLVQGEATREVPADSLAIGDRIRVLPGERIPADGTIVVGLSAVDEAAITGESVPVAKGPGGGVYAGSINADGALTIVVTAEASDTTLARIVRLVTEAEAGKAPTARFIDRFSRYYTPAVLAIAVLVAIVPPLAFGDDWRSWIYKALALLLIGCPCALVLSTPAAITSAISAGARQGLLLKGGGALEALARVRTIAFDKTGTLPWGAARDRHRATR